MGGMWRKGWVSEQSIPLKCHRFKSTQARIVKYRLNHDCANRPKRA